MKILQPTDIQPILEPMATSGIPPEQGISLVSIGLDRYLTTLDQDYLNTFIQQGERGGAAFQLVLGEHGGRTHLLSHVRDIAWQRNYVVAYVSLEPDVCSFTQLQTLYRAIASGLRAPPTSAPQTPGIESLIRAWSQQKLHDYQRQKITGNRRSQQIKNDLSTVIRAIKNENRNFVKAIYTASAMLLLEREAESLKALQWLMGQQAQIKDGPGEERLWPIDNTTAFSMIHALAQWLRAIGYCGLVILLDDTHIVQKMSKADRQHHLYTLREMIDKCGHARFRGMMIFYAIPSLQSLQGKGKRDRDGHVVYEALRQRLDRVIKVDFADLPGVSFNVDTFMEPKEFLQQLGQRLAWLYAASRDSTFVDLNHVQETIKTIADKTYYDRFRQPDPNYRRQFVQDLLRELAQMYEQGLFRAVPSLPFPEKPSICYHPDHGIGIVTHRSSKDPWTVRFHDGRLETLPQNVLAQLHPFPPDEPKHNPTYPAEEMLRARTIIEAFRMGIVPDEQLEAFTVGRDQVIESSLQWLADPQSSAMTLIGTYGTGKTHFLNYLTHIALRQGFAVAHVEIDPNETPFHRPRRVYSRLAHTFQYYSPSQTGTPLGLTHFLDEVVKKHGLWDHEYFHHHPDYLDGTDAWVIGHEPKKLDFFDHGTAANVYCYLLSGLGWAATEVLGLRGLLLLFDEAEVAQLSYHPYNKELGWNFLRTLLATAANDPIMLGSPEGTGFAYAKKTRTPVPFLYALPSGLKVLCAFTDNTYEAHVDRHHTKLRLNPLTDDDELQIFRHICNLYAQAYQFPTDQVSIEQVKPYLAGHQSDHIRTLVKGTIEILDLIRARLPLPPISNPSS